MHGAVVVTVHIAVPALVWLQGLECINKTLPEIEVRMVFRQHKLQYDPPLEELRIKHYKDYLNTFLGLPLR